MPTGNPTLLLLCQPLSEAIVSSSVSNSGRLVSNPRRSELQGEQNLQEYLTFPKEHFQKRGVAVTTMISMSYGITILVFHLLLGNLLRFFRLVLHSFRVQVQEEVPKKPNE